MTFDRPAFHFAPARGWINDPNGLVYHAGEYHLFYQHDPYSTAGGGARMNWGHAVSPDLIGWTECPVALAPDPLGAIWSGSAVVDWRDTSGFFAGGAGLVALYTQWRDGVQVQSLAHSADRGRTWTKYAGNPVIAAPESAVFRDPKVCWHAATGQWIMVVTIGQGVRFYASSNLRDWRAVGEFGTGYGSQAGIWECPDLFPLPVEGEPGRERWILLISVNGPAGSTMEYFVGDFDGATFTSDHPATTILPFDYGRDCYAAVTWSDVPSNISGEDSHRLAIGWMNNWRYARQLPGDEWRGAMTLPRELRLRASQDGPRLIQAPISELARSRGAARHWSARTIAPGAALDPPLVGEAIELQVVFGAATAREFGLRVRQGDGRGATIGYDTATRQLFIERGDAGNSALDRFGGRQEAPLAPATDGIALHIFVDRCSIEIFAAGGAVVLTDLFFPADNDRIEFYALDGTVELSSLEVYLLASDGGVAVG